MNKKNILEFKKMKSKGEKLAWITAYDFPTAVISEEAGVDMILVGDSGGMVQLGYESTIPVTMEQMLIMSLAVRRGAPNSFIIGDMPFGSYELSNEKAVLSAIQFIKDGNCDAVKLEGGKRVVPKIKAIVDAGVVTVGHLGLTPQSSVSFGGYRVQGKSKESFEKIYEDALALQDAGVFAILLEAMPSEPAGKIAEALEIPVYGIGAGNQVDGQLLIMHDLLGYYSRFRPKFAKCYVPEVIDEYKDLLITNESGNSDFYDGFSQLGKLCLKKYIEEVKQEKFPGKEFCYPISDEEKLTLATSKYWNI